MQESKHFTANISQSLNEFFMDFGVLSRFVGLSLRLIFSRMVNIQGSESNTDDFFKKKTTVK